MLWSWMQLHCKSIVQELYRHFSRGEVSRDVLMEIGVKVHIPYPLTVVKKDSYMYGYCMANTKIGLKWVRLILIDR